VLVALQAGRSLAFACSTGLLLVAGLGFSACRTQSPPKPAARANVARLPPEVVQRVVRSHYDDLRRCYESALAKRPWIEGRVAVRLVIQTDGRVASAENAGSDLPDPEAIECMFAEYRKLVFPSPEGGIVTVVYPIVFTPDEGYGIAGAASLKQATDDCDGHDVKACQWLGHAYRLGLGVRRDGALAARAYEKACDFGGPVQCDSLGWALYRGEGVARDVRRAKELFEASCKAGSEKACGNVGILLAEGVAAPRDLARALALCKPGCAGDKKVNCGCLGYVYALDPAHHDEGLDLLRGRCSGKKPGHWACEKLRELGSPSAASK
jgi:TPR repeat protein